MDTPDPHHEKNTRRREFTGKVHSRAERKRRREEEERGILFWVGMFGLVGWSVSMPLALFTWLGVWMDKRWPGEMSWTLTMLLVGMAAGCAVAWYWVKKESSGEE